MHITRSLGLTLGATGVLALALSGCGSSGSSTTAAATSAPATSAAAAAAATGSPMAAGPLTVTDAWVKSAPSGMTAVFATLRNTTSAPVTVVKGSTDAAGMTQLHETVTDNGVTTMREKAGGFVIPAGGELQFAPGGNHLMLMDLKKAIRPGDEVDVTLTLGDGSTVVVKALGKDFAGAKESYLPSMSASMSGM